MRDTPAAAARAVAAKRLIKQAAEHLRKAGQQLAQAHQGHDVYGHVRARDAQSSQDALELVRLAVNDHGEADIVVLIPPHPRPR